MFAPLLAMMFSSAPMPITFTLPKSQPQSCTATCAKRYRLPTSSDDTRSIKDRALAEDGGECNLVRSRICRAKPHTWMRANY